LKKRTKKLLLNRRALPKQFATAFKNFLLLFFKKEVLVFSASGAGRAPPIMFPGGDSK
jgi:hypothetical protein